VFHAVLVAVVGGGPPELSRGLAPLLRAAEAGGVNAQLAMHAAGMGSGLWLVHPHADRLDAAGWQLAALHGGGCADATLVLWPVWVKTDGAAAATPPHQRHELRPQEGDLVLYDGRRYHAVAVASGGLRRCRRSAILFTNMLPDMLPGTRATSTSAAVHMDVYIWRARTGRWEAWRLP
jgi:hypothetical protein